MSRQLPSGRINSGWPSWMLRSLEDGLSYTAEASGGGGSWGELPHPDRAGDLQASLCPLRWAVIPSAVMTDVCIPGAGDSEAHSFFIPDWDLTDARWNSWSALHPAPSPILPSSVKTHSTSLAAQTKIISVIFASFLFLTAHGQSIS